MGIQGAKRRGKKWRTTLPDPDADRRPDLVQRDFPAEAPDRLWVADSQLAALLGRSVFYFSFVIDVFKPHAWSAGNSPSHMRTTSCSTRCGWHWPRAAPPAPTSGLDRHHSDAGSPVHLGYDLHPGPRRSLTCSAVIGTVGDAYDNAHGRELRRQLQDRAHPRSRLAHTLAAGVRRSSSTSPGSTTPACMKASATSRLPIRRPPRPTVQSNHSMNNKSEPTNPVSVEPGLAQGRPR